MSRFSEYLLFLNNLGISVTLSKVLQTNVHYIPSTLVWVGIESLTCAAINGDIYDIDIRYARSKAVFRQSLVDHGWSISTLTTVANYDKRCRRKIIVYFCSFTTNSSSSCTQVAERYLIGSYWKSVEHLYTTLPCKHPFRLEFTAQNVPTIQTKHLIDSVVSKHEQGKHYSDTLQGKQEEGGLRIQGYSKSAQPNYPLISIITVVFNGEDFLEQTIQSVIAQNYKNFEYIIIDGASTDRTLDIIRYYEKYIDYWISEPDLGIYDAMNKGFMYACGEFINFMNSGDLFFSADVLSSIDFPKYKHSICGTNLFFSNFSCAVLPVKLGKMTVPHQALFTHRSSFELYQFDINLKYTADAELWIRMHDNQQSIDELDLIVSLSRFGGISTNVKYLIPRMKEHLRFERNKIKVVFRFLPKILVSQFLSNRLIEFFYFKFLPNLRISLFKCKDRIINLSYPRKI